MPEYLIHVGPHKTGTTYLQTIFASIRERLGKDGVAYPAVWSSSGDEPSHRKLVVGLREARIAELRSQFDAIECENPEYVLISAEGINHLPRSALELLRTLVGRHAVSIIFYCRRWSELLSSFWQEEVKHGQDETFPDFFSRNLTEPFDSVIMNFARRLDIYSSIFGRENVKLISYSDLCDDKIDLAAHFLNTFLPRHRSLIDDQTGLLGARPNPSLPPLVVEVIRALNSYNIRDGVPPPSSMLRNWYMAHAGRFDLAHLFSAIEANAVTLPFSDASSGPRRLHETLSTTYGDLMVRPKQLGFLFAPRQADIAFFGQRYMTDSAARQALDGIHADFRWACRSEPGCSTRVTTVPR